MRGGGKQGMRKLEWNEISCVKWRINVETDGEVGT